MTEAEKQTNEPKVRKLAYFPGCVIPIQLPQIEKLARDILPKIGIELTDLNFSCCPSGGVKDIDDHEWLLTGARNLAVAEEEKLDVVSVCTGCAQTLIEANHELKEDRDLKNAINDELSVIGKKFNGKINAFNLMHILSEMKDNIAGMVKVPLTGLRISTHPGCHLLKPSKIIGYDDAEHPHKFDEFVEALGAKAVDYTKKTVCCGASALAREREMSLAMMKDKLDQLNEKNIDLLTMTCPTCYNQFDKNAKIMKKAFDDVDYTIPVVHILQLLGLALGMTTEEVFLKKNRSVNSEFVEKIKTVLG